MRRFFRYLVLPVYRIWALRYIRRERVFSYAGLVLRVPAGIFHPGVFFSTPIFLDFLQNADLQGKSVLDVGTGSGALALLAAKRGARVTAIDIAPEAVETATANAKSNALDIRVIESDLFENLPAGVFDVLLINPPYYPRRPLDNAGFAFFAGENFEYFERLFAGLRAFTHPDSQIWMILSEDCDFDRIREIARKNGFDPGVIYERKTWGERFFVAQIREA